MRTDEEDLAFVIANASCFVATAFLGRARTERVEAATLEAAREAAAGLYRGKPIAIYAIARNVEGATMRQRHVENWEPRK